MRIIDRLARYLDYKRISVYSFERNCQVANGYFKKQQKGKGTVGSDILERIYKKYDDLNLHWLVGGEGGMIRDDVETRLLMEESKQYYSKDEMIQFLNDRIALLQKALTDKEKIIYMMEGKDDRKLVASLQSQEE